MPDFQKVASVSDFSDGEMRLCELDDQLVIVVRVGDQYHCIDDVCTHDGGTLSDGTLDGCAVACPRHGAKFDLATGEALTMPATESTGCHRVKVQGDDILVKLIERH